MRAHLKIGTSKNQLRVWQLIYTRWQNRGCTFYSMGKYIMNMIGEFNKVECHSDTQSFLKCLEANIIVLYHIHLQRDQLLYNFHIILDWNLGTIWFQKNLTFSKANTRLNSPLNWFWWTCDVKCKIAGSKQLNIIFVKGEAREGTERDSSASL